MKDYTQDPGNEVDNTQAANLSWRKLLKCMAAWTGTGIVWTFGAGGLLTACGEITTAPTASSTTQAAATTTANITTQAATTVNTTTQAASTGFTFVQVSDTHIGFSTDGVNTDVTGTLQQVITRINAMPQPPAFVLHTGDVLAFVKANRV